MGNVQWTGELPIPQAHRLRKALNPQKIRFRPASTDVQVASAVYGSCAYDAYELGTRGRTNKVETAVSSTEHLGRACASQEEPCSP